MQWRLKSQGRTDLPPQNCHLGPSLTSTDTGQNDAVSRPPLYLMRATSPNSTTRVRKLIIVRDCLKM